MSQKRPQGVEGKNMRVDPRTVAHDLLRKKNYLKVLAWTRLGNRNISELSRTLKLPFTTVYKVLRKLEELGLVEKTRGLSRVDIYYKITPLGEEALEYFKTIVAYTSNEIELEEDEEQMIALARKETLEKIAQKLGIDMTTLELALGITEEYEDGRQIIELTKVPRDLGL